MSASAQGNCYICGGTFGKTAMKNHQLKGHGESDAGEQCYLLKIEDPYNKDYWLYADVPLSSSLSGLDAFLRKIWLECCGHLSAFFKPGRFKVPKNSKWGAFSAEEKLEYEYDFGSTTELAITIIGETARKKQKTAVRLLARNVPPLAQCAVCGKPATMICAECYDSDNPFFCDSCVKKHEHEFLLPVVNSPRMGVCGYDGELDVFAFSPVS
ncbi:MAG: hypothetical protein Pg6C_13300 [Treponemataceae bacterium]|nr:MAG: hypothetical protein Pg6C_13300 [Treponemataceae bacterium]